MYSTWLTATFITSTQTGITYINEVAIDLQLQQSDQNVLTPEQNFSKTILWAVAYNQDERPTSYHKMAELTIS